MEKQLEQAIVEQLGYESIDDDDCIQTLKDVCKGGADGGFSGFTYSADCLEFYRKNKPKILQLLADQSDEFCGGSTCAFIKNFNCLKDQDLTMHEIEQTIFCNDYDAEMSNIIIDAVCWCVLETLAFEKDR